MRENHWCGRVRGTGVRSESSVNRRTGVARKNVKLRTGLGASRVGWGGTEPAWGGRKKNQRKKRNRLTEKLRRHGRGQGYDGPGRSKPTEKGKAKRLKKVDLEGGRVTLVGHVSDGRGERKNFQRVTQRGRGG